MNVVRCLASLKINQHRSTTWNDPHLRQNEYRKKTKPKRRRICVENKLNNLLHRRAPFKWHTNEKIKPKIQNQNTQTKSINEIHLHHCIVPMYIMYRMTDTVVAIRLTRRRIMNHRMERVKRMAEGDPGMSCGRLVPNSRMLIDFIFHFLCRSGSRAKGSHRDKDEHREKKRSRDTDREKDREKDRDKDRSKKTARRSRSKEKRLSK